MVLRITQIWNWNLRHGNPRALNLPHISIPIQFGPLCRYFGFNPILMEALQVAVWFVWCIPPWNCVFLLHDNYGKTRDRESWEKLREVDGRKAHSSWEPSPSSTCAAKKDICIILWEWNIWECRIQRSLEADVPFHFLADIRDVGRWWDPAIGSNL